MEIYLASEVDAECDSFGDILIKGGGDTKMRISRVAALALASRLVEAAQESEARPPAPKKEWFVDKKGQRKI